MSRKNQPSPSLEIISSRIFIIRGQRVMLDTDLAALYGVATKRLNEQVRRNITRFPDDFMFQLTLAEKAEVVANCDHLQNLKFSKTLPLAFTEHGTIQAANVINSSQAVELGIFVVRAFVQMREMLSKNKELATRLDELDKQIQRKLETHDRAITGLIEAIRKMMAPEIVKKRPIGFVHTDV